MTTFIANAAFELLRRQTDDLETDPDEPAEAGQKEIFSSWALFILICLLILSLFCSFLFQLRRIQAVHETIVSVFFGMVVGLILRITPGRSIQDSVSFDYQFFFNLLLPPIILASGYELHQVSAANGQDTWHTLTMLRQISSETSAPSLPLPSPEPLYLLFRWG